MLARQRRQIEAEASAALPERPTLRSISPRWAALTDRYRELTAREAEIEGELAVVVPILREGGAFASSANLPSPPPPLEPEPPSGKVVALLGPLMPKRKKVEPATPKPHGSLKARANDLSQELDAVREAKALLLLEIPGIGPMAGAHRG